MSNLIQFIVSVGILRIAVGMQELAVGMQELAVGMQGCLVYKRLW